MIPKLRGLQKLLAKKWIGIDYPPDFASRYGHQLGGPNHIATILDGNRQRQLDTIESFKALRPQLSRIAAETSDEAKPSWRNVWFPVLDGLSYYGLVATRRPAKVIEIGSGQSTRFARQAVADFELPTQITCIDPQPRADIQGIAHHIHRASLENMDLSLFASVAPGDIVFLDGSHRCFQNSDVTVFFLDVLPSLPAGTLVGIHDIFWPNDYPEEWRTRYYNEQYVLGAYMVARGASFEVPFSSSYVQEELLEAVSECFEPTLYQLLRDRMRGGCLWFTKPDVAI